MGLRKWLQRRKWKYLLALAAGGISYGAWVGLIADPKPEPVPDIQNVVVETVAAVNEIYKNY